ncbi:hypothetical protein BV378_14110 [Nostoc sp. RF31YmG]|jgi:hypothetical protein|nr:hypothetical protein BV378_14110 [Nostoc sp. RF31YmG]
MKPAPQFLPPRQSVVYLHTNLMLHATGTNQRSFGMVVAENYLRMVSEEDREERGFRITHGSSADAAADKKHNGQILGRYLSGDLRTLPANLEDAWVMSLPEPHRSNCERDLARRRGMLAVAMPAPEGLQVASVATLMGNYANLVHALAPAIEDGRFGPEDLPYRRAIEAAGRDVIAAVIGIGHELDRGIYGELPSA